MVDDLGDRDGSETDLKFLYAEMNGFDINTDRCSDLFGYATEIDYTRAYELPYDVANTGGMESTLTLIGMEPMQRAFEWWGENEELRVTNAGAETLAQLLVECRFIELLRNALHSRAPSTGRTSFSGST
jgi:hypothetical protein